MFTAVVGQQRAVELLTQAVRQNRVAPAYLFVGPDGVGRKLVAKCSIELLFSTAVESHLIPKMQNQIRQGNHPALLWVEPTYQYQGQRLTSAEAAEKGIKRKAPPIIRLEQIREITHFLSRPPLSAPRNVVVIEQAETMAESAANALLKTLEEPGRATLILIAPSIESVLPTLVSRCQKIPFYRLNSTQMAQVLEKTGNEIILQNSSILSLAAGSPGNAIASYQQLQAIPSELLTKAISIPQNYRTALELAREIDRTLEVEVQLWLVDYLQQSYWKQQKPPQIIEQLEKARKNLLCYAQPRLVWECTFLALSEISAQPTRINHR